MVICPRCGERVNNSLLRADSPKCSNGDELGRWVFCKNLDEKHVYLTNTDANCPYCGSPSDSRVVEGTRVKCIHENAQGVVCSTRPFLWIKEGPPCFMNHVGKMRIE